MLIGVDQLSEILTGESRKRDGLTAHETVFGWSIFGRVRGSIGDRSINLVATSTFWDLEIFGITKQELGQKSDENLMERFNKEVQVKDDGRYEVRLPFKADATVLSSNYWRAERLLRSYTNKLVKSGKLAEYDKIFQDWESNGIIEKVANDTSTGRFTSHYPVYNPDSLTTPVRPVFNASEHDSGNLSLNQ